jgi:Uma2 family endonuclease
MSISTIDVPGRLVLDGVRWDTYERLVDDFQDQHVRLAYDRGRLEIMSPTSRHDWIKRLLARFVDGISRTFKIPIRSLGSATLRRADLDRGIEADEWFYVASEAAVRGVDDIDMDQHPPPDVGIEVDVTSTIDDRLPIYWALGIAEIWVWRHSAIRFLLRHESGEYVDSETSRAFPFLTSAVVMQFLDRRGEMEETALVEAFLEHLRNSTKQ